MIRKSRILIVDDEPQSVRLQERILQGHYEVTSAYSGEEALTAVSRFHPELILLDINMPGMDGYETCRRIRQNDSCRLIKIFLVSGRAHIEERLKGYEVGADDYMTKPFDSDEFLAKVNVFIKLRRTEEIDSIKSSLLELLALDVKEPLDKIIETAGRLIEDPSTPDTVQSYLRLVVHSSIELRQFADKADRLHRLKQGLPLQRRIAPVGEHLRSVAHKWMPSANEKDIQMTLDCPADLSLCADWEALDEVIGYLIDNAVKHTGEGRRIVITASLRDETCLIRVADEGEGIDPAWVDNIFTRFAVRDVMHHHKGQGLSLAIAKQVIELHGGEIHVQSTLGCGTAFTILLPLGS